MNIYIIIKMLYYINGTQFIDQKVSETLSMELERQELKCRKKNH